MKKIAFVVQQPRMVSPGQRFRFELWEPILEDEGYTITTFSFLDTSTTKILYKEGFLFRKTIGVLKGFMRRWVHLFKIARYDYVFLQREVTPLGPPVFEWILAKVLQKKIIYDFDDAIWVAPTGQNKLLRAFKAYWKVRYICKWSYRVVGGNDYLCNYARQFNKNVFKIPTCVDTVNGHNRIKDQHSPRITIGWTGSHSTMPYLELFMLVYRRLIQQYRLEFIIISNKEPIYTEEGIRYIKWEEASEIEDLLKINIGIMPLTDDEWSEGKCGFKLIQYLALGIPAVASPIGVNKIIVDGSNGYLCAQEDEWYQAIEKLINDTALRVRMGQAGRTKMQQQYCIWANKQDFLKLFVD